jgi:hypothetical protein
MTPLSTILIITGIVTLWLWMFNLVNHIKPEFKVPVNMGVFAIVTVWLLIELIRRWV